jgi:hypothetical protein
LGTHITTRGAILIQQHDLLQAMKYHLEFCIHAHCQYSRFADFSIFTVGYLKTDARILQNVVHYEDIHIVSISGE